VARVERGSYDWNCSLKEGWLG